MLHCRVKRRCVPARGQRALGLLFALGVCAFWTPGTGSAATQSGTDELLESRKMFLSARAAVADGQFQEALDLYRKVLAKLPSDPVVHLEYAQLLRDLNVVDEATAEARKAVEPRPEPGRGAAAARRARALRRREGSVAAAGRHRAAHGGPAARARRRRDGGGAGAGPARGRSSRRGRRRSSTSCPEVAGQPGIQRLTAEAKAKSGRWKEAEALYRSLHEVDPADREISAALVDLYEDQDKMDEALALLEELAQAGSFEQRGDRADRARPRAGGALRGVREAGPASSSPSGPRTPRPSGSSRRCSSSSRSRRRARRSCAP